MAFCGKCAREVPALAIKCPYCEHDFLPPETPPVGWEYSRTADVLLFLAILVTSIVGVVLVMLCVMSVFFVIGNPSRWREFLSMMVQLMIGIVLSAIQWIVLSRVQGLSRRQS